jgi:UDP-N-acetyl-D-galactosamine dehydrogenase
MESESSSPLPDLFTCTVGLIGLGYVGLPLAIEFARGKPCLRTGTFLRRRVIGFDVNYRRLEDLRAGRDRTCEVTSAELHEAIGLSFTADPAHLAQVDVFVVTVPTPIDTTKRPDLTALEKASVMVGQVLQARHAAGAQAMPVVVYESTVYPGATEEVCVPILETTSGLVLNQGFACGYSPERINPGDTDHKLTAITKVTSGSNPEVAAWVDAFYGSVIAAGTHQAPSIKVAEAAKVIENTQRDLNIALVNELAMIFSRLGIDTLDVLEAAGSKWNFLPFRPGLVGGHCIGVDPYYLTHKAEQVGYHTQVVLAGRRINDGMAEWVVQQFVLELARRQVVIGGARVLVMGLTFKENCPDLRNTRVIDLIKSLKSYGIEPFVVDPWADPSEAKSEYGLCLYSDQALAQLGEPFAGLIVAVAHRQFCDSTHPLWQHFAGPKTVIFDLKGIVPRSISTMRL